MRPRRLPWLALRYQSAISAYAAPRAGHSFAAHLPLVLLAVCEITALLSSVISPERWIIAPVPAPPYMLYGLPAETEHRTLETRRFFKLEVPSVSSPARLALSETDGQVRPGVALYDPAHRTVRQGHDRDCRGPRFSSTPLLAQGNRARARRRRVGQTVGRNAGHGRPAGSGAGPPGRPFRPPPGRSQIEPHRGRAPAPGASRSRRVRPSGERTQLLRARPSPPRPLQPPRPSRPRRRLRPCRTAGGVRSTVPPPVRSRSAQRRAEAQAPDLMSDDMLPIAGAAALACSRWEGPASRYAGANAAGRPLNSDARQQALATIEDGPVMELGARDESTRTSLARTAAPICDPVPDNEAPAAGPEGFDASRSAVMFRPPIVGRPPTIPRSPSNTGCGARGARRR